MVTGEGEKWFVTRSSVLTRIEELNKFDALRASRQVATNSDASNSVVQENKEHFSSDQPRQGPTQSASSPAVAQKVSHPTSHDRSRRATTGRDVSEGSETSQPQNFSTLSVAERELYERLLAIHEEQRADLLKDKELLQTDKEALLRQLEAKDKQIERFFESERDTKTLAGRLQSLMSALWPKKDEQGGERYVPMHEALESGLPEEREQER